MTQQLRVSSILLLLAVSFCQIKNETPLIADSDVEEEEEKMGFGMRVNESSIEISTLPPVEDSSLNPNLEDDIDSKRNNVWWMNDTNVTDYDEGQDEKKDDASPENSVDRNLLENVNYLSPDKSVLDLSNSTDFNHDLISPQAKSFGLKSDNSTFSTPSLDIQISPTRSACAYGDRKCSILASHDLVSKYDEHIQPTDIPFTSSATDKLSDSFKLDESSSTEQLHDSSEVKVLADYTLLTPSESTTAQTSDNLILIENSDEAKDESVIQAQLNKSDKTKEVIKHRNSLSEVTDEMLARTVLKTTEITPLVSLEKEHILSETSTVLSKIFSSVSPLLPQSEQISPVKLSSFVSFIPIKTNTNIFSEPIEYAKKIEQASNINLKTPFMDISMISSTFSTASWQNLKSSVVYDDKISRNDKKPSIYVLTSSFSESPVSSTLDNPTETYLSTTQKESEIELDSSFLKEYPVITPIFSSDVKTSTLHNENTITGTLEVDKKERLPPPRLTNPGCSSLPACVEITLLDTTWEHFCSEEQEFLEFLSTSLSHYTRPIHSYHIVLDTEVCSQSYTLRSTQSSPDLTVAFYVVNDSGEYEERMTEICGLILRKWAPSAFKSSVIEVHTYSRESHSTPLPIIPEFNSGFVAAVSISAVAGVALCLLCILLVIMKQKLMQGRNSDTTTPTVDAYSLDSLSISASFRRRRFRRSARSYLNHAFNDQEIPSHPLNEKTLSNCLKSKDLLEEEFKRIPMTMPKLDSIPEGAHVKNRYSNILPKAESRVVLADPSGDPLKCYINANFVKGFAGKSSFYIACQAPLPEGIEDFWRMVWEQQCRVIIMLTMFEENGISRCAVYFPQSTLISQQPFGDFQVSLLKKDVYEFYTLSTLRLLDLEKNLFRDIVHLWFTGWPEVGVPKDSSSLVTFVQQCRPFINCNTGPTIVHCSTGTGRSGVFLALDICMREYDESISVDILQCISQLRRDRAGAVQNKDQYILIHEAMHEYITRVINQSQRPSLSS